MVPQCHFAALEQNRWIWQQQCLCLPNTLLGALGSLQAGGEEAGLGLELYASPFLPSQGYGSAI